MSSAADEAFMELNRLLHNLPNCGVGGPLHIVTDDLNATDSDLDFCVRELRGHWSIEDVTDADFRLICETTWAIVDALRPVSEDERERLLGLRWW